MSNIAVIYARVSSKDQERDGFSIPAQKKAAQDYALKMGFKVERVFEESESAKAAGRTQFMAMIEFLKTNKKVNHVLVEKTDRLYRNFKDFLRLDPLEWTDLRIHFIKENEILSKESKSHQKFIHGVKVLMAKNYSDNLSEEVRKGMTEKAAQGFYPSVAPIGYINNRLKHRIEPDAAMAPLVKLGFEMAASGSYSLAAIKKSLFSKGMRAQRSKRELSKSRMQGLLTNPIYHGDFVWKGVYYKGSHTPLIEKNLFDKVQASMGFSKIHKAVQKSFPYIGLMKCAHCGCSITAEEKIKPSGRRYVYYRCTSGKGYCDNVRYIREEKIEGWVTEALGQIQLPLEVVEWTREAIQDVKAGEEALLKHKAKLLETRHRGLTSKISGAYADKLDGTITPEFWAEQNSKWTIELSQIESDMASSQTQNSVALERNLDLMELARTVPTLFKTMTNEEKREMLNLVLSNPQIKNGSLCYDFRFPFSKFVGVSHLVKWRGGRDSNPRPSA